VLVNEPAEKITAVDAALSLRDRAWARWHEVQIAIRPAPVVVGDLLGKDTLEVMLRDDEQWSRQSARNMRTHRSAKVFAFAFGERTGVRMVMAPIEAKIWSMLAVNLISRSRMRKRRPASSSSVQKLRATWVTQGPLGLVVTPRRSEAIGGRMGRACAPCSIR
jgi:hypothetical protein